MTATGRSRSVAEGACQEVHRRLAALGSDLYAWGDGELGRLNAALRAGRPARVESDLLRTSLTQGLALKSRSGGRFDPTVGELVAAWGFADLTVPPPGARPSAPRIAAALERMRHGVQLAPNGRLTAPRGLQIDLGGLAKGALLAAIAPALRSPEVTRLLVDFGGDMLGLSGHGEFRVAVADPEGGSPVGALTLAADEAVMTSGGYARFLDIDGVRYQHILDPRSGWPVAPAAATVVDRDPVLADAAATALVVADREEFDAVCDAMRVDCALRIDTLQAMQMTPAMTRRFRPYS